MRRGPPEPKRPADAIGNAVRVVRIATGEEAEELASLKSASVELGGDGNARATRIVPERNGVPLLPVRNPDAIVTLDIVNALRDEPRL